LQNFASAGLVWAQKGHWGGDTDNTSMARRPEPQLGLGRLRYLSEVDDEDLAYAEMREL